MVDLITEIMKAHCYGCDDGENDVSCKGPCDSYEYTEEAVNDGLREWLSSFDTNSATECFTAVNLLKMKIAQEEMHEADVPDTNVGEVEVQE